MSRQPPTFYIFHGDDEFSRQAEVQAMRGKMGDPASIEMNTATFDGKTSRAYEVISAASIYPFLADKRLIIVDGMLTWFARKGAGKTGKAELETLVEQLPGLPDTARLVFVEPETLSDSHIVLKLATQDPHGFVKAFNPPRDPIRWIVKQVEKYGGTIELPAAAALAAVIGSDLRAADSECFKLVTYVGGERAINEDDVSKLTPYVAEAGIFDMVDALAERNSSRASTLMHRLLEDQQPLSLLGMVNRQFRLLVQTREVLDAGGSTNDLLKVPEIRHPFVAQKLTQQARNYTLPELEDIHRYLLETDYGIKSGKIGDALALDLLVASLCK